VRLVKAATLTKLVECLASDEGELETTYVNIFLATYRSFSTASQVLGLLIDRYFNFILQLKQFVNFYFILDTNSSRVLVMRWSCLILCDSST